jgi:dolichol-phosphate mannosyltransferase
MVFVDDGSSDRTFELASAAAAEDPRIVAISLSRNFGHQAALSAALEHVSGDVVVLMDGDLQDSPEAIPTLIAEHEKGYDVVYVRRVRRKEGWFLRLSYYLFYRILAAVSSTRLPLDSGDFALLSRRVVEHLRRLPEHHRYLRGLRSWVGFPQSGVSIEREGRHAGRSKYSFFRRSALALDALFAFSVGPLRLAVLFGLLAVFGSSFYALYAIIERLFFGTAPPRGFPALIVAIIFLAGVQLLVMGLIGEYLGRVYEEVKGRPHYIVRSIVSRAAQQTENQSASRGVVVQDG